MIFGVVLQKTAPTAVEQVLNYQIGKPGEDMETLAGRMEALAEQNRRAYPAYYYRTMLGELTHEIEPPKPVKMKVRSLKAIGKDK